MNVTFDLNALRTVVAGVRLGSFARAARHLGRSQSAISMQLKKLEEQAGVPLFVRDGNRLVPTQAGRTLLNYAERMVDLNDEAAASIGTQSTSASVKLGMPQDFADEILSDVLTLFSQEHPNVHVEAHIGRNYALAEEVRMAQLDVALVFAAEHSPESHADLVAEMKMAWASSEVAPNVSEEEPVPLVAFNFPCEFRTQGIEALEREGRPWRCALTTPSLPGIWAAVSAGLGVTVRTEYHTPNKFLRAKHLADLPKLPDVHVYHLAHPSLTPAAATLSHIVRSVAGEHLN